MAFLDIIYAITSVLDLAGDIYNSYERNSAIKQLTSLKNKVNQKNITDQQAINELANIVNRNNILVQRISPNLRSMLNADTDKREKEINKLETAISGRNAAVDKATDIANNASMNTGAGGAIATAVNRIGGDKDAKQTIQQIESSIR